jgi:tripartite-type tricarboxylate transporter receptor subunit TctC
MPAIVRLLTAAGALLLAAGAAHAQAPRSYPTHPVRVVVGFTAGGPTDVIARLVAQKLSDGLGQNFYVENVAGAGGNIAAAQVARAPADGYTLHVVSTGFIVNPSLYAKGAGYDPVKDFTPVSLLAASPNVISVNPAVPAKTAQELIALVKANPGKYNFASSGHGAAAHLAGELFKSAAKVDIVHVPYKGAAPALQDVIAGHVHMMFATAASVVQHIRDGQVRPLAVTTLKRTAVMPDIPTVDELGLKGFDATTWHGLVTQSKTPKEVVATLHRATVAALNDAAVKKQLGDLGVDIVGSTPEEFAAYIKSEIPKWTAIVKASGATLE